MKALLVIALVVCALQNALAVDTLNWIWKVTQTYQIHELHFSPDDKYILVQNFNNTCVVEAENGETVYTKIDMAYPVWFKDGKHFLALFDEKYFAIVETGTWMTVDSFPVSGDHFCLSPDESTIAVTSISSDKLSFYDVLTKKKIKEIAYFKVTDYPKPDLYPTIVKMVWSSDNRYLIYTAHDGQVHFWDTQKDTVSYTYGGGGGGSNLLVKTNDGSKIAFKTSKQGVALQFLDIATKQIVGELQGNTKEVSGIAFSPNDSTVAVSLGDNGSTLLNVYRYKNFELISQARYSTWGACSFSNNNKYLTSAVGDILYLYDVNKILPVRENEEKIPILQLYPNPVKDVLKLNLGLDISEIIEINIISENGTVVLTEQKSIAEGSNNEININISTLTAGAYTAIIETGNKKRSVRFIKL